jgi:N-acetylmuramoyl-L-alanine amidase CwlA
LADDRIRPHHAWTGKDCPVLLLDHAGEGGKWREFLALVAAAFNSLTGSQGPFVAGQSELDSISQVPPRQAEESAGLDTEEIDHRAVAEQLRLMDQQ